METNVITDEDYSAMQRIVVDYNRQQKLNELDENI
jgi:hypothetical protein